ncbi:Hypothetical predicted protein [Olea europaea subsp. europaea]|uniref:Uncharacterized protein n=1 Tax=Olea europaea subsp. europaea TaxID=158383 RepID=A0A8S0R576_OLEEU|nr:Hypothetical predicted protein [Olea europaea subsp. europaea]
MCIAVFIWNSHPLYPFLLLLNRDEYHSRSTSPLGWWEDGEILGGRDGEAGGTWLACTRNGRLAFVTNVREIKANFQGKSRGGLPVRFLKGKNSPKEFADELMGEADQYHGFNLIVADLCSMTMLYITNRTKDNGLSVIEVSPGIHVLSNATLDTPWPKAQRLMHSFKDMLDKYGEAEISIEEMTANLMRDTTKDDESKLPHIYPPEFECQLSSIFVEADTSLGRYGTRSTSAVVLRTSGDVSFYETHLQKDLWKEQTICYHMEKGKVTL